MKNFLEVTTIEGNKWYVDTESIVAFSAKDEESTTIKLAGSHETVIKMNVEELKELFGLQEPKKSKVRTSSYHE